jgi:glutamine synthetase
MLGTLVHAGLDGIRRRLAPPPILDRDPARLTEAELARYNIHPLPQSLSEALNVLYEDKVARAWLPPLLYETYVGVKRAELAILAGMDDAEICRRYAAVY